jgi:ADP-ribose pyrophosphatase YjhB (NUDIX family)
VKARVHRISLAAYRLLPTRLRRRVVRLIAPTFSVGANCVVLDDDRVLLVRLSYRKRWGLPGGLVARREVPAAAAIREAAEEVGLAVEPVGPPAVVVDADARRVDIVHRCRVAAGADADSAAPRSPEIVETRWFAVDNLPELQRETADALAAVGIAVHSGGR